MASSNIPFTEIEQPSFKSVIQYNRSSEIRIPSADTMQRRVLKMGDDSETDIRQTIYVSGQVAASCAYTETAYYRT